MSVGHQYQTVRDARQHVIKRLGHGGARFAGTHDNGSASGRRRQVASKRFGGISL